MYQRHANKITVFRDTSSALHNLHANSQRKRATLSTTINSVELHVVYLVMCFGRLHELVQSFLRSSGDGAAHRKTLLLRSAPILNWTQGRSTDRGGREEQRRLEQRECRTAYVRMHRRNVSV